VTSFRGRHDGNDVKKFMSRRDEWGSCLVNLLVKIRLCLVNPASVWTV
jgi:hypothetical protein